MPKQKTLAKKNNWSGPSAALNISLTTWVKEKLTQHILHLITVYPKWRVDHTWLFVHMFLSKHVLYQFLDLSSCGPVIISIQLQHDHSEQTEKWKRAFCQEMSYYAQESWPSAMTGLLLSDWLRHNHKKMPVADGLFLPPRHTHACRGMKMNIWFIQLFGVLISSPWV